MRIKVVCPGRAKGPFQELSREYERRIGAYAQISVIETPEVRYVKEPAPKERDRIIAEEGLAIQAKLDRRDCVIALDVRGKQLASEEFAAFLGERATRGVSSFAMVLGGSLGLDPAVKERADLSLSLSLMTLPHMLARVVLLEQVYRALAILRGDPYHK